MVTEFNLALGSNEDFSRTVAEADRTFKFLFHFLIQRICEFSAVTVSG